MLDYIRGFPEEEADACSVSYEPSNTAAKKLYASYGFIPNGEMDDDEEITALLPARIKNTYKMIWRSDKECHSAMEIITFEKCL